MNNVGTRHVYPPSWVSAEHAALAAEAKGRAHGTVAAVARSHPDGQRGHTVRLMLTAAEQATARRVLASASEPAAAPSLPDGVVAIQRSELEALQAAADAAVYDAVLGPGRYDADAPTT